MCDILTFNSFSTFQATFVNLRGPLNPVNTEPKAPLMSFGEKNNFRIFYKFATPESLQT